MDEAELDTLTRQESPADGVTLHVTERVAIEARSMWRLSVSRFQQYLAIVNPSKAANWPRSRANLTGSE
jgi:hypothetical protein